ncbi:DEAD/DEAH box helicase family protein [Shewanella metallivivens]|uniref:DEAD/DEAH box helicase family protein n=1 Tax=Shewanella metallivivens TaxID=2872342 RepID=A0ABT5TLX9_9GAMM|nr:DEAD/DEAH box helicase family protein [Shewanella metallivivens]MDD8058426.1 DEAD/DEAH box helicase family protein [Shewanella metallivivens]
MKLAEGPVLTSGGLDDPFLPKLLQAINRASSIEISVSFIQRSGLDLIFDALSDALERQATIDIVTSDYLYITDPVALRHLMILQSRGAKTKIFTCKSGQSFHMKTYIFIQQRKDQADKGCAYVGSNNISKAAFTHAFEWCLRHDLIENQDPNDFNYIRQQFLQIFNHQQSIHLNDEFINRYADKRKKVKPPLAIVNEVEPEEPAPNSAQQEALAALANTRRQMQSKGLVVLATGMGKTWLAAFDVQQFNARKVLFVAHREEILLQAERTFKSLLPKLVSGHFNAKTKVVDADIVFASIQTLGQQIHLNKVSPNHFDYVIVDEFHHAGASSYQSLLNHFTPQFLLGLTATPERTDQADILSLCDNNLVYEKNIVDGIELGILVPFHYQGINDDTVNYQDLPWRNGKFDPKALEFTFATQKRAKHVFSHWQTHKQQRTLAFCVSKAHADFMAHWFAARGIKAVSVHSDSDVRRAEALNLLASGKIEVIFSVDLFNEGTDLPSIDTILILRPTESKILFLQQLGRGLRTSPDTNKQFVSVIDFIGNHISFLNRPMALLQSKNINETVKRLNDPKLHPDCVINIAPELINFWQQLKLDYSNADQQYQLLKDDLGHRPTATEFYHSDYSWGKLTQQFGSWFELVLSQEQDDKTLQTLTPYLTFLSRGVEKASMSKSFKAILLEAFIELDGLRTPPSIDAVCIKSWQVFKRYPNLWTQDVKADLQQVESDSPKWRKYWLSNPITFLSKQDSTDTQSWFKVEADCLHANIDIAGTDIDTLSTAMRELTALLLARYSQRKAAKTNTKKSSANVITLAENQPQEPIQQINFYPDLKIACGHFKTGTDEHSENRKLNSSFNRLDPSIHFIAPASGNSMNGGKNPIHDGDLLLLERVTAINAGSITGKIMAIEIQDEAGDNQYLLRKVSKLPNGQYQLNAHNLDYAPMIANESMVTFARLKQVLDAADFVE